MERSYLERTETLTARQRQLQLNGKEETKLEKEFTHPIRLWCITILEKSVKN
jgi:hypothetical protein